MDYTELLPIAMNDNTSVKIPFMSRLADTQSASEYMTLTNDSYKTDGFHLQPAQNDNELDLYNSLVSLYRDYPTDMFIAQLLKMNTSCEVKLEQTRQMLFSILRECDDFPYGLQTELKKRVSTRRGEPLCMKLASDIHVILSVLEGEDMGLIKSLLSTSRTGRSLSYTPGRPVQGSIQPKENSQCQCCKELPSLRDSISSMQADLLLTKQRGLAHENTRENQLKSIYDSFNILKQEFKLLIDNLSKKTADTLSFLDINLKRELSNIKSVLNETVSRLDVIDNTLKKSDENVEQECAEVPSVSNLFSQTDEFPPLQDGHCPDPASVEGGRILGPIKEISNSRIAEPPKHFTVVQQNTSKKKADELSPVALYSEVVSRPACRSNIELTTSTASSRDETSETRHKDDINSHIKRRYRPNNRKNYGVQNGTYPSNTENVDLNDKDYPRGSNISVRVSNNRFGQARNDFHNETFDESQFDCHVRKRTKSYYIGGFKNSITVNLIHQFISHKGLRAGTIKIFPCKRNSNDVIIRANIFADDNVHRIVEHGFWPRGVICKPWLSRNALNNKRRTWNQGNASDVNCENPQGTSILQPSDSNWNTYSHDSDNIYNHLRGDAI